MNSDGNGGLNGALHGGFEWAGAFALGGAANEMVWRCTATRAGKLYNRVMFDTRAEADEFARTMRMNEPDQMFSVEAVEACAVWN